MQARTGRYAFRVAGRMGATTLAAFPELVGEEHNSETVLTGEVCDCAALYGIVHRLESLGLELIDMRRVPSESAAT